jgi:hypothetical protein
MANAAAAAASGAAEVVNNYPFTAEQVAMLMTMLEAREARSSTVPQTGCCPANQQESQQLSDMKRLKPTRSYPFSMPSFVLHQLPPNPQDLYSGNIPLLPVSCMPVSTALQNQILDKSHGTHLIATHS